MATSILQDCDLYGNLGVSGNLITIGSFSTLGTASTIQTSNLVVLDTILTQNITITDGAQLGYVLQSDAIGNALWASQSSSANFANTDLTLSANRIHNTGGNDLVISSDGATLSEFVIGFQGTQSLSIGHNNYYQEFTSTYMTIEETGGTNRFRINAGETTFGSNLSDYDLRMIGMTDSSLFFLDASTNRIGIGTQSPAYKLHVVGDFSVEGASEFDSSTAAGETRFLVYDVDAGTLKRVSVGATDSGGVGFKVLRITN